MEADLLEPPSQEPQLPRGFTKTSVKPSLPSGFIPNENEVKKKVFTSVSTPTSSEPVSSPTSPVSATGSKTSPDDLIKKLNDLQVKGKAHIKDLEVNPNAQYYHDLADQRAKYEQENPGAWSNTMPILTHAITQMVTKPLVGIARIGRDLTGSINNPAPALYDDKGEPTEYGKQVQSGKQTDVLGKLVQGLDAYNKQTDISDYQHPLPHTLAGNTATGIIGIAPDIISTTVFPEERVGANLLERMAFNPFNKVLTIKGGLNAYSQAEQQGATPTEAAVEGAKGAGKSELEATAMNALSGVGHAVSPKLVEGLEKAGIVKDNYLTQKGSAAVTTAALFGAYPVAKNLAMGKPFNKDEMESGIGTGIVFGLAGGSPQKAEETRQALAVQNFMNASPEAIKSAHEIETPAADINAQAVDHAAKFDETKDPQHAAAASTLTKTADVKATTDAILKDKDGFIKSIQDSNMTDDNKQAVIDKVNEIHKQLDPIEQQKTAIGNQIAEIDQHLNELQSDKPTEPVKQAENEVRVEQLTKHRDDLNNQLKSIITKNYENEQSTKKHEESSPHEEKSNESGNESEKSSQNGEEDDVTPTGEGETSPVTKEQDNAINQIKEQKNGGEEHQKGNESRETETSGNRDSPVSTAKGAGEETVKPRYKIKGDVITKLPLPEHSELNTILKKEDGIDISHLKDANNAQRDNSSDQSKKTPTNAEAVQQPENDGAGNAGKDRSGESAENTKRSTGKTTFKKPPVKSEVGEALRKLADKVEAGQINKLGGFRSGTGFDAVWDTSLKVVAETLRGGAKIADAIEAGLRHIRESDWYKNFNDKKDFEAKYTDHMNKELGEKEPEGNDAPEMIEANNAYMDAKVEGKFGADALDTIISKLQDTNLENIVNKVKAKIKVDNNFLENTRKKVLDNQGGSELDQAALLMDQYSLKGQEENTISEINAEKDVEAKKPLQKQLEKLQGDILDNALANRLIGREASSVFRLRQVAVDQDANIHNMREKYMATEGLNKLTPGQEEFIRQQYQGIRDAETEVKRLRADQIKIREENERLQRESEAFKKIIDAAKEKHKNTSVKSKDALTRIRSNIDASKKRLAELTRGQLSANAILNPELYKELKNIAVGKAEELYVKTKSAIKLNQLVKAVLDEIKDVAPHLTEDDIREAISGRNGVKIKPKSELQKNLADLKSQAAALSKINDLENNIALETKKQGESSPRVKELQKRLADLKKTIKTDADYEAMKSGTLDTEVKSKEKSAVNSKQENINRYKAIQRQIKEIKDKLTNGDFTTPAKEAKQYEKSPELQEAEHELAARRFVWEKGRKQALMKNRPLLKKIGDNILQWQRFAVLSRPSTLIKLGIVAAKGVVIKPFQLAFQEMNYRLMHFAGKVTGINGASGDVYGKVRPQSVAKFYSAFIRNFSVENLKNAFKGMDEQSLLYGTSRYMEDYDMGSGFYNDFLEGPGRSHGYIKSFLMKPETAFAHEQLIQSYIENYNDVDKQLKNEDLSDKESIELEKKKDSYDLSNDEVLERINTLASEHGKWAIFMNRNHAVEKFRTMLNSYMGDKQPSLVTKTAAFLIKSESPILKIPVNYARRFYLMKYGMIKAITGTGEMPGLIRIAIKGTDGLTDQNKELLSRTMTYGSMGAATFMSGYLLSKNIKKKADGSVVVGTHEIPKLALDSPVDDTFLTGVTFGRYMDKTKGQKGAYDWGKNFVEADIDVDKKMPFVNLLNYGFFTKAAQAIYSKKPETGWTIAQKAASEKLRDMIEPGLMQEMAEMTDTHGRYDNNGKLIPVPFITTDKDFQNKRKPQKNEMLKQTLETGVPGLRKNVPKNYAK